jgi:hypothetical protein
VVQGSMMPSAERGATGLAAKRLYLFSAAMFAISDQSVDVSLSDSKVQTLLIGTGEALGGYPLGCSSAAFHLTPGTYRCRDRSHLGGAEATDGTINRGA